MTKLVLVAAMLTVLSIKAGLEASKPRPLQARRQTEYPDSVIVKLRDDLHSLEQKIHSQNFANELNSSNLSPEDREQHFELINRTDRLRLEILNLEFEKRGDNNAWRSVRYY